MSKKKKSVKRSDGRAGGSRRSGKVLLKFFGFFALAMVIFYAIYYSSFYANYVNGPLLNFQAKVSNVLLTLLGQGTSVDGDVIYSDDFRVSIKGGCDGGSHCPLHLCSSGLPADHI